MPAQPKPSLTDADLAALRAEYESGASALSVLARRFSLSPRALGEIARRMNFGARPPVPPFQRRGPPAATPEPTAPEPPRTDVAPPGACATQRGAAKPAKPKSPPRKASKLAPSKPKASKPAPSKPKASKPNSRKPKSPPAALAPLDMPAMAERLRHAAERELVKINDQLEAGGDVERRARVLSSLVKTLGDLARLAEARDAAEPDDSAGWSLDDLRATLARRIDLLTPDGPPE